jgi:glycerophosphoryl diester phosphodiesterase
MRAPGLVAHRGCPASHPENSLAGLRAALDSGARWIEFDVQLTADGVPVLLHDADLERLSGTACDALVLALTELRGRSLHEPARLGDAHMGTRVVTLSDALALLDEFSAASAFVEIKYQSLERFGESAVLDAVLPMLAPWRGRVVLISFEEAVLRAARACGWQRIGWVLRGYDDEQRRRAETLAPEYLFCKQGRLGGSLPWPGPWCWVIYDVNDAETALALAARGVALIETDEIASMIADPRLAPG